MQEQYFPGLQMTSMLDILDSFLEQRGIRTCRIDGSVPWQERQRSMHDFNTDPVRPPTTPRVLD